MKSEKLKGSLPFHAGVSDGNAKSVDPHSRVRIRRLRAVCVLVVFLSVVVGLFVRFGWGTLSSMGIDAVAYVCPLGALETLLAGHEPGLRIALSLACVLLIVALFGRFFCSWICVVPPLSRFFHPRDAKKAVGDVGAVSEEGAAEAAKVVQETAGEKGLPQVGETSSSPSASPVHSCSSCGHCGSKVTALEPVGGDRDGIRLDSRHGVLAAALVGSLAFGFPVFCLICPIGLTIALVIGIHSAIFEQNPTVSILVIMGILLVELVFFRKWCHKICPVGAFMSLVGVKAPFLRPRVDGKACLRSEGIDCKVCVHECPELLDPHSSNIPECTKCGQCIEACPAHAISFRRSGKPRASRKHEPSVSPTQ